MFFYFSDDKIFFILPLDFFSFSLILVLRKFNCGSAGCRLLKRTMLRYSGGRCRSRKADGCGVFGLGRFGYITANRLKEAPGKVDSAARETMPSVVFFGIRTGAC